MKRRKWRVGETVPLVSAFSALLTVDFLSRGAGFFPLLPVLVLVLVIERLPRTTIRDEHEHEGVWLRPQAALCPLRLILLVIVDQESLPPRERLRPIRPFPARQCFRVAAPAGTPRRSRARSCLARLATLRLGRLRSATTPPPLSRSPSWHCLPCTRKRGRSWAFACPPGRCLPALDRQVLAALHRSQCPTKCPAQVQTGEWRYTATFHQPTMRNIPTNYLVEWCVETI